MEPILYLLDANQIKEDVAYGIQGPDATVLQYDAMRAISALQGILNRDTPRLAILTEPHDIFWLDYLSEEGKMLSAYQRVVLHSFDEIMDIFADDIRRFGLVLWDETVPATVNVAGTIAGVEDTIPVRGSEMSGSICQRIIERTGASVKRDLRGMFTGKGTIPDSDRPSSGSAKCDAYLWAMEQYMDRTHPTILFYTVDGASWSQDCLNYPDLGNAFVYNQDYAVAKRAFVVDLHCWDDEAPCDEPNQPIGADFATLKEILQRKYDQTAGREMITVCGFVPWHIKYTVHGEKGKHAEVESEWRFTEVISAYNCIKDADAAGGCSLANASIYTHFPLKERYTNHKPTKRSVYDPNKRYVLVYVGDYDASAWTARHIPQWYRDPALGAVPCMWCFNTNLSDRIPQAFDFVYERYTENDVFAAGDSGAGYNNPRLCYEPRIHSDNPACIDVWNAHNRKYFTKFDQNVIGFVIDGTELITEREMKDMATYATLGVGYLSLGRDLPIKIVDGSVFIPVSWDIYDPSKSATSAAQDVVKCMKHLNKDKRFYMFRTILASPTVLKEITEQVAKIAPELNVEFTDPYSFFEMAKEAKEKGLCY